MFFPFLILLLLDGVAGILIWLGWRRVAAHLQAHPEAAKALAEHVLVPLLTGNAEKKPEEKKTRGTLV